MKEGYTTIEQGKKLAEILPIESADMYYTETIYREQMRITCTNWEVHLGLDKTIIDRHLYIIPCWSLAALLDVLIAKDFDPETMFLRSTSDGRGTRLNNVWRLSVDRLDVDITLRDIYAENLVDACVEMILKLHEQNLI